MGTRWPSPRRHSPGLPRVFTRGRGGRRWLCPLVPRRSARAGGECGDRALLTAGAAGPIRRFFSQRTQTLNAKGSPRGSPEVRGRVHPPPEARVADAGGRGRSREERLKARMVSGCRGQPGHSGPLRPRPSPQWRASPPPARSGLPAPTWRGGGPVACLLEGLACVLLLVLLLLRGAQMASPRAGQPEALDFGHLCVVVEWLWAGTQLCVSRFLAGSLSSIELRELGARTPDLFAVALAHRCRRTSFFCLPWRSPVPATAHVCHFTRKGPPSRGAVTGVAPKVLSCAPPPGPVASRPLAHTASSGLEFILFLSVFCSISETQSVAFFVGMICLPIT